MNRTAEIIVGAVFFVGIAALVAVTVYLGSFGFLQEKTRVDVTFDAVAGLKTGDKVQVSGVDYGTVVSMHPLPEQNEVHVTLEFDGRLKLYKGYAIEICDASILGGKVVSVLCGTPPTESAGPYRGTAAPDVMAELGDMVRENKGAIRKLLSAIVKGEGTLGKLIHDQGLYDNATRSFASLAEVADDLKAGKGTLGKLLKDDAIFRDMSASFANLTRLTGDLATGKGTLGKLLVDDSLFTSLNTAMTNMTSLTADMRRGKGTVGRLFRDDSLYKSVSSTFDNLHSVTGDLVEKDSTLKRLMVEDDLYKEFRKLVKNANLAVEEARQQAPINAFASLLGAAF